jgi:hypothetical protein
MSEGIKREKFGRIIFVELSGNYLCGRQAGSAWAGI